MSKGSIFFGQARGKLGNMVLARVNGQEVQRSYNAEPKNPQTGAQMLQRAILASVSEMYIRGTRNFFKYAFENKKPTHSEFNAFCSQNIGRVPANGKAALKQGAPAIGNYLMTCGSLREIKVEGALDGFIIRLSRAVSDLPFIQWTVSDVSAALMASYGCSEGDIITFVDLHSDSVPYATVASAIQNGSLCSIAGGTTWDIKQFKVNTQDTTAISSLNIFADTSDADTLVLKTYHDYNATKVEGVCVVVSRVSGSNVRVSTSYVVANPATQHTIELGLSNEWKQAVPRHWIDASSHDLAPQNILQGSMLTEPEIIDPATLPEITSVKINGSTVASGSSFTFEEPATLVIEGVNMNKVKVSMGGSRWTPQQATDTRLQFSIAKSGDLTIVGGTSYVIHVTYNAPAPAVHITGVGVTEAAAQAIGGTMNVGAKTTKLFVKGSNLGDVTASDVVGANGAQISNFAGGDSLISFTLTLPSSDNPCLVTVANIAVATCFYSTATQLD